jgi:NAD(P)-dependent dehydrogenase (short-subunit alcohol dehydrogenase family)
MTPRSAVITGATGGIGRWIALGLLESGLRLFVIGRDPARLDALRGWAGERMPGCAGRLETVAADLSLLGETRAAGETVLSRTDAVSVLVNNAGTFSPRREITVEGHERTLAVNLLSPFVLSRALLPGLRRAEAARIVNVGSSTSDRARIDPDDLELARRWGMVRAYSQSKLALLMTSLSLAQELSGSGITVNVVHPGLVATGLVRNRGVVGLAWKLMAPFALTEQQGADTPLHAALSAECEGLSGTYLKRRRPARPNPLALDPLLRARVLAATEALAAPHLAGARSDPRA